MNPATGDVLLIPTADGKFAVGQVIAFETRSLHCVSCGFFDQRVASEEEGRSLVLDESALFSTQLVAHTYLRKKWSIVQNQKLRVPKKLFPYEKELKKNGVGVKILDVELATLFLNAFYGLAPWNEPQIPDYFEKLLISPSKKPANLIFK